MLAGRASLLARRACSAAPPLASRAARVPLLARAPLRDAALGVSRVPSLRPSAMAAGAVRRFAQQTRVGAADAVASGGRSTASRWLVAGAAGLGIFGIAAMGAMAAEDDGTVAGETAVSYLPPYVRARLQDVFSAFGGGVAVTAGSAFIGYRMGIVEVMARMSPLMLLGATAVTGIGSMLLCIATPKENVAMKLGTFGLFNACMGLSLAPVAYMGGPIVLKAALYTGALVGSLALVAANSPSEKFLYMGAPLAMGLGVVAIASIAPMFMSASSAAVPVLYNISLYGGLALFSGFTLYDTQKIIQHSKVLSDEEFDPFNESIHIYMDAINIFVRMVQILGSGNRRK